MSFLSNCYLCQSAEVAGLCDVGGTTPDLRPACRMHAMVSADAIIADLTEAQRRVVERAVQQTSVHSGRGGEKVQVMRALERKKLVKQGKVHIRETDWSFTPAGHAIGALLHRSQLDKTVREKSTSELKAWFPNSRGQKSAAIMQELELRGWQFQGGSAPVEVDWVRVHTPEWQIVEGIAGLYGYHVRDASLPNAASLSSACGARVMTSSSLRSAGSPSVSSARTSTR